MAQAIKVGDRITFKSPTRWDCKKVTRVVNGFDSVGRPTVRYGGWDAFIVIRNEISAINGEGVTC